MILIAAMMLALPQAPAPRAQVAEALDRLHLAAHQANASAYFGCYTEDATFLGTDANERWSLDQFRSYAEPIFESGRGWTYLCTERHIQLSRDANVAWFDERLQNEKYGEVRGSGVLELVGEQWKIAQYNLAFPVPNDHAAGLAKKSRRLARVGQPVAEEFVVRDGDRSLFVWNKVVPVKADEEGAERPVVVLLPTASFSARAVWDLPLRDYSMMDAMARAGFDVFAVELGGYGLSSAPTDIPAGGCKSAVRDLGLVLDEIAKQRGSAPVFLVGLSWGSQVAASYSAQHPERLRGLVLYGHLWRSRFPEQAVRQAFGDGVFELNTRPIDEAAATGDFVADQFEPDVPQAFAKFLSSQGQHAPTGPIRDYVHELPVCQPAQLSMPTLMLYGRSEFVPPTEDPDQLAASQARRVEQREFYAQLPDAKHWIEVPGAGHTAHLDRAHILVQDCLVGWLKRQ